MITTLKINERELILKDRAICEALKYEATAVGISLEEYVDRFLELFYAEPEKFYFLLREKDL